MATSYNGWFASPNLKTRPLVVAGESFAPGISADPDVFTVLQYVAEQMHKRVEPVVRGDWHKADDWGFAFRGNRNANNLSNHASGTAIDYNATRHPNGKSGTFTKKQVAEIHQILKELDGVVRWGGHYTRTKDEMHFEINANKANVRRAARKVRRGNTKPTPKPTKTINQVAGEVLQNKWGVGAERERRLKSAGYNYDKVQAEVKRRLNAKKSVNQVAKEVLDDKWGVGDVRKRRLTQAGYNYDKVQAEVVRIMNQNDKPKPKNPTHLDLKFAHVSMQHSDSDKQKRHDAAKIFELGYDVITGTEAGGKDDFLRKQLRAQARKHGYRFHLSRSVWVAISRTLIEPNSLKKGYVHVVDASSGQGRHTDRGIAWVTFDNAVLGTITAGAGHYLPKSQGPQAPNWDLNKRMARAIGKWARDKGKGSSLVFYGGDQNIQDKKNDTFFGAPMVSSWDELGKHPGTGHGNIDVIASYNGDARVKAQSARVLGDKRLFLHTDHKLVETIFRVKTRKK